LIVLATLGVSMTSFAATSDELHVLGTGVFEFAVRDLAGEYKRQTGHALSITIVNAGTAAKKLEGGESYDVVLSSSASLDALAAKGLLLPATKVDVGRMRLGAVIKSGARPVDIATSDALRKALLAAPAIAYIDPHGGGSSGVFFGKLFAQLGVTQDVESKGVLAATGADVVEAVSTGKATFGMTQASELIGAAGVQFVGFLPAETQLITVYAAAVPASAKAPALAKDFIRFLTSPIGLKRLQQSGWETIPSAK
jgi:molybdate transport system substrate-binding protein